LSRAGVGQEIHGGLQVVEQWNSGNTAIFYGKDTELTRARWTSKPISYAYAHAIKSMLDKQVLEMQGRSIDSIYPWRGKRSSTCLCLD
jgi:TnpA family transposase